MSVVYDTKIKPRLNDIVKYRSKGISTEDIASLLEVEENELKLEIQEQQDLYNAWYKGDVYLIEKLESALFRAAIGQEVTETEVIETVDEKGGISVTKKIKTKFVQSVPAAIKALETIHSQRWANVDKTNNEIEIILPKELIGFSE